MKPNQGPFDPSALERAAVALRELNQSPHASKALETMMKTEEAKKAKFQALVKERELEKIHQEATQRRENMQTQKKISLELQQSQDQKKRARHRDKLRETEETNQRISKAQEDSVRKQEEIRRETISFQMKKQAELEEKKIRLKSQLEAESYRRNFDLIKIENEQKAIQERMTRQQIHETYIKNVRDGFQFLFTDKSALKTLGTLTLYTTGAYFLSKYGLRVAFSQMEAYFNKPVLVRETSRLYWRNFYKAPAFFLRNALRSNKQIQRDIFRNVVLNDEAQHKLESIAQAFLQKRNVKASLNNLLFYGPPGTGKTLFAKQLAHKSGLHYAIISGGDIEKMGSQASAEIDKLFTWARSTRKGTIIFIDEAESVFYKRGMTQSVLSNALSTLLAQTSSPSEKISLIIASNLPNQLDRAALDRMDSIIKFEYQGLEQRIQMVRRGLERICTPITLFQKINNPLLFIYGPRQINHNLTEDEIALLAEELEGISARQIDKFMNSVYNSTFTTQGRTKTIDLVMIKQLLKSYKQEIQVRKEWE